MVWGRRRVRMRIVVVWGGRRRCNIAMIIRCRCRGRGRGVVGVFDRSRRLGCRGGLRGCSMLGRTESRIDCSPAHGSGGRTSILHHRFIRSRSLRASTVKALPPADAATSARTSHASTGLPSLAFSFPVTLAVSFKLAVAFAFLLPFIVVIVQGHRDRTERPVGNRSWAHWNRNRRVQSRNRSLAHADVLANTDFDALVGKGARERR